MKEEEEDGRTSGIKYTQRVRDVADHNSLRVAAENLAKRFVSFAGEKRISG